MTLSLVFLTLLPSHNSSYYHYTTQYRPPAHDICDFLHEKDSPHLHCTLILPPFCIPQVSAVRTVDLIEYCTDPGAVTHIWRPCIGLKSSRMAKSTIMWELRATTI